MGEMSFAFETQRMRVFEATVTPWPGSEQIIFVAFFRNRTAPQTVAHAVVTDERGKTPSGLFPLYCELLEVSSFFRRKGYGTELLLKLEEHLGDAIASTGVTREGELFLNALGRPTDPFAPYLTNFQAQLETLAAAASVQGNQEWLTVLTQLMALMSDSSRPVHERLKDFGTLAQMINEPPTNLPERTARAGE